MNTMIKGSHRKVDCDGITKAIFTIDNSLENWGSDVTEDQKEALDDALVTLLSAEFPHVYFLSKSGGGQCLEVIQEDPEYPREIYEETILSWINNNYHLAFYVAEAN